ncbi:MAG TPA: D-alanyl-D-alanine carboxypeptidase/D-alanyl-D-alanine-endopeptidase [Pyrinomonadaceae bacterium]
MSYSPAIGLREFLLAPNNVNKAPSVLVKAAFLLVLLLLIAGCSQTPPSARVASTENEPAPVETASPITVQIDPDLAKTLDSLLSNSEFSQARWGVAVVSLRDGKLIYEHNGDQLFTPASNMKVYTTAVALDLLGADYRWRTSVYSDNPPDSTGTINGDLVLYGRGAPDLIATNRGENSNSIEELAKSLAAKGVKRIQGNVIGDESYFRGDATGDGWLSNDLQWYFGAEASALTINANSIEVSITSASKMTEQPKVEVNDFDGYIQTTNNLATVESGEPLRIGVKREATDNNITVWGQYPIGARGYGASLSVHQPSLWAAKMFLRTLRSHGISVDGEARYRDSRVAEKNRFNPEGKQELAFVTGKSLSEIIRITNKLSVNLFAEILLRTLGRERAQMISEDMAGGRERGDDEHGRELIKLWLSRQGIKTTKLAIHDGSGLSRLDLVTPQATAQLLAAIRKTNSGEIFADSLPIAGTDGTLGGRLASVEGRIVAKTGTLSYDNSLSGYLTTADGQIFSFSVICNDFTEQGGSVRFIDQLMLALFQSLNHGPPKAIEPSKERKP